ncbi:nucleoside triphosphate pyrophosphohydrolase, partial [Candidatus Poribacteria bacterium]|nr:nucleoside triphosphate pyrophosphohydrolase [Candidatus Poribacteria bacterium]
MENIGSLFEELVSIIARLRGRDGCPWDKQQTNETLKPGLIEESYEIIDAIDEKNDEKLEEELGDLLMQILLNSQIAQDEGRFNICGVIKKINEKLLRRHPHVFGEVQVRDAQEVLKNWEMIKRQEYSNRDRESLVDGVPSHLPALMMARKVQAKASRVGFDWEKSEDVLKKVEEEMEELKESIDAAQPEGIEEEIGDILFSIVNLSRFLNVDPEDALRKTIAKFIRRFKQ